MSRLAPPLLLFAACARIATAPQPAPSNTAAPNPLDMVPVADRMLRDDAPLDYARPLGGIGYQRSAPIQLYRDACAAGDHRSCWMAMGLVPDAEKLALMNVVATRRDRSRMCSRLRRGRASKGMRRGLSEELPATSRHRDSGQS